jgi:four helix bundle protein
MRNFRKLIGWQKAHLLTVAVHQAATKMRSGTAPGLRSQLLRAASSIPANIAEGSGKRSEGEFARYVDIAIGSTRELENHLTLARDLNCIQAELADQLLRDANEVGRILFSLVRAVQTRSRAVREAKIAEREAKIVEVKEASATD